jgi:methionyl-tRNA synthetase
MGFRGVTPPAPSTETSLQLALNIGSEGRYRHPPFTIIHSELLILRLCMENIKRYTVTAALPYANGPVHIGHLAGCYLPADIYARYLRAKGHDVLFLCGSDEHGVGIALKAKQEGTTPKQIVEKYHPIIEKSFKDFGISFDFYSRTSSQVHYKTARAFFKDLYEKDIFIKKKTSQYYDVKFQQFLADRYIIGTCPNCGYDKAYGDQCEHCGTSLDPNDLIEPRSALSGEKPEMRETEHWFLPLQNYQQWLEEWILGKHSDWKNNVIGQCGSWLKQGLQERAVTRDLDWGVPVPLPDAEGKVLYVWFDAPIGYISAAKEWAKATGKDWEPYWKDADTKLVHFIGKDNIVFHCIVFPVMLKAHGEFILPDNVPANEFLNIEGEKISTSRNWAVWLHEYLHDFPGKEDALRYVLCSNAPETKDNDFTWKDFQAKNNNELAAIYGNLVNRVTILTHKYFDGLVPVVGELNDMDNALAENVAIYPRLIAGLIEQYKFREALQELMNLARAGNKYLTDNEPWKSFKDNPARTATVINNGLQLIANLAILGSPFLPFTSEKLFKCLDMSPMKWDDAGSMDLLKEGGKVDQAEILFEKIEDTTIYNEVVKLHEKRPQAAAAAAVAANAGESKEPKISSLKPTITFEDFSKTDLRIATIIHAEEVPKTKKLLKLTINIGLEERVIVSGIAEHYKPQDIIGKQICVVANLEPRAIKGIESKGMILMIHDEAKGGLVMIQPESEVEPGSAVN